MALNMHDLWTHNLKWNINMLQYITSDLWHFSVFHIQLITVECSSNSFSKYNIKSTGNFMT